MAWDRLTWHCLDCVRLFLLTLQWVEPRTPVADERNSDNDLLLRQVVNIESFVAGSTLQVR